MICYNGLNYLELIQMDDLILNNSFFLKNVFICYFRLHWVFAAVCRPSLVVVSGGYSHAVCRLLIVGISLLWSMGSRTRRLQQLWRVGLGSCGAQV